MFSGVKNAILALGCRGSRLKINGGLGGGVRCGGASPEYGGPERIVTTRRDKGGDSAGDQTRC